MKHGRCRRGHCPRGARAHALRRRYGCFRLPKVAGARVVKAAARNDVTWLARTDPDRKEVEFSEAWSRLSPAGRRYIVLHEQAHLKTGPDHNESFFDELRRLVSAHRVSWKVAYELEIWNCHRSH